MKFSEVEVRRFQSLWDTKIALGDLTVIIGPSNSGKSALGRAVRCVARNTSSPGIVSSGATTACIILRGEDGQIVSLERGKGTSTYSVIAGDAEERYPKSGVSVPEDVTKALGMPEADPELHFATQFDPPYLLSSTATTASQVLGDLTNVSMLADAAREANRRRLEAQKKTSYLREEVTKGLQTLRENHADLPTRKASCEAAREAVGASQGVSERLSRISRAADEAKSAQIVAERLREGVCSASQNLEELSSAVDDAEARARTYSDLENLVRATKRGKDLHEQLERETAECQKEVERLQTEKTSLLAQIGQCPLCGATQTSS